MKTCLRPAGTWHALRSTFVAAVLVTVTGYVAAQSEVALNPAHPDSYVVQRGDTLWDISKMFLNDPWYWPEIWYVNPQVQNPHLIYPGDVLSLVYVDGQPRVQLSRGSGAVTGPSGTERLSPSIRYEDMDQAITAVALEDIRPFLAGGMIMDKDEIEDLPHIVGLRERMIAGAGHEIYVSDIPDDQPLGGAYLVLRIGDELRDPDTNKMLGYEVIFLGRAELRAQGNPAEDEADTLFLTDTDREAIRGDRVKVADLELPLNFFPSAPSRDDRRTDYLGRRWRFAHRPVPDGNSESRHQARPHRRQRPVSLAAGRYGYGSI